MNRRAIATLALSAAGLIGIVSWEGYRGEAYVPVAGDVATIGFGSTRRDDGSPVQEGDRTSPVQALQRALRDVTQFEGALKQCVHVPLSQGEYDAFTSLAYNIGPAAFCASTLVRKLNAGDYAGACEEILRWNRFQGRVLKGLVNRRESEYRMCKGDSNA